MHSFDPFDRKYVSVRSDYMNRVYQPAEVARVAKELIRRHPDFPKFDTLVGTGLSGSLILPPLARALRKKFLVVRKPGESNHSCYPAEGELGERWVFVDDLIESGDTFRRCVSTVDKLLNNYFTDWNSDLVGVFLYGSYGDCNVSLETARVVYNLNRFTVHRDSGVQEVDYEIDYA